jgi:hypothetical protein
MTDFTKKNYGRNLQLRQTKLDCKNAMAIVIAVNYDCKVFYVLGTCFFSLVQCYGSFYGRKLLKFVVSKSVCPWPWPDFARVKHLEGFPLLGRLLSLPTNGRRGWKGLPGSNTLAYDDQ